MFESLEQQNHPIQIERLAAQRHLYSKAKIILGYQFILSVPVTILFAFIVFKFPDLKYALAFWGVVLWLTDILILNFWQKSIKNKASTVQEMFDCDVLALPINELKINSSINHELVKDQSDKYQKSGNPMPPLRDWYPISTKILPTSIGRIVCQRANCWWDGTQRRYYAGIILIGLFFTALTITIIGLATNLTLQNFFLILVAPLMPIFSIGMRQFFDHTEAADRLDKLQSYSEKLWKRAMSGEDHQSLAISSRLLQDEIFEGRKRNPLIFDFLFSRLRTKHENQMIYSADNLIQEALCNPLTAQTVQS